MSGAVPVLSLHAVLAWIATILYFTFVFKDIRGNIISTEQSVKHNANIVLKHTLGVATCFGL
jgi:hypothetical protein